MTQTGAPTVPLGATRILATFIAEDSSPLAANDRAVLERSLGEWLSAALAGRDGKQAQRISALRAAFDSGGVVPCVGSSAGSAPLAAWANAAATATSPLVDTDAYGADGSIVWSALFAASSTVPTLSRLLDAAFHGIRGAHAVARVGRYRRAERGFDQRGVFGLLAAAMACSRLRGHDVLTTLSTISVASSFTGGLLAARPSEAGVLIAADAARDGLVAALLAEHGISGAPDMLEGRQGFGEAYFGLGASDLDRLAGELDGSPPLGQSIRALAFGGHIDHQRPVLALLALLAMRGPASTGQAERIVVEGVPPTSEGNRVAVPRSTAQARHSLRYVLATALERNGVVAADFDADTIADRVRAGALDRVDVRSAPRWNRSVEMLDADATDVSVWWSDRSRTGRGLDELPLSADHEHLVAKWRAAAIRVGSRDARSAETIEAIWPAESTSVALATFAEAATTALGLD